MEKREIIFVVLFLAYWVFTHLAKKFMQKQKPEENKGFTVRVLEFINELAESHEGAKEASENERNQMGSPQSDLNIRRMYDQAPVEPRSVPLTVEIEEVVAPTVVRQSAREQHLKPTATPLMKQTHEKITVLPTSPVIATMEKGYVRKFPKQKLRDAIIWSEILGTPVGLRDN